MIINLTQHSATTEQRAAGVVDLPNEVREAVIALLTVDALPARQEIEDRCHDLAELACYNGLGGDEGDAPLPEAVMIGGAPWMMRALEDALRDRGLTPLYAFSRRESVEQAQPDGSVRKVNIFRHAGWVEA